MIQHTLIHLHLNDYSQEFHYYPVAVKLDRYDESCNTLNDLSKKVCAPNSTEDSNLRVFNIITGIYVPKTSTKHISGECKCRFDESKCNADQWWNSSKMHHKMKTRKLSHTTKQKLFQQILMKRKQPLKPKIFIFFLEFLFITIALLIALSIYYYLIKYPAKQKHLLSFHIKNKELKKVLYEKQK